MAQGTGNYTILSNIQSGYTDGGIEKQVPVTSEGHLEVAVHSPRLPFGSLHTENLTPIFQSDGVYGLNSTNQLATTSGSGTATTENSSFKVSTGTTIYSVGAIQSRKRLRYRPGQGTVLRFAATFTTGVADSYQVAGQGHSEDGYFFGYKNSTFGILHNKRGVREVQTLTVTTGATSNGNVTITLNSVAFTVAVTNASNIQRTVWEISQGTYAGWRAEPRGATVVFLANDAGVKSGTFSFNAGTTGSAATIASTRAGVAATETFIPQSSWNGDVMDGGADADNPSGVLLDPTKGNVYQIQMQYLGFGSVSFWIETATSGRNNAEFVCVHTIKNPNNLTDTHVGNPSMPFTMAVYSAGSTTDLSIKVGSFGGFIEGQKVLHGNRYSYFNQLTTVGATNYQALFTVMNTRYFKGVTNQSVINIISTSGALKHTQPCVFYIIKNGTLTGNPNFSQYATDSCSYVDTSATTVSVTSNDQIIWSGHLGETGEYDHHFGNGTFNAEEFTLQPGEWLTLAAKASTGTPAYVTGSINTREDQ